MHKLLLTGTDLSVARVGLGTAGFGADIPEADAFRQMDTYVEMGGNLIDTARIYNDWAPGPRGRSELVIGRWLNQRGNRARVILSTKGAHPPMDAMHIGRCRPEDIKADLTKSLNSLQTDWADIYYLHRDDPQVPIADIAECLEEEVRAGRIRWYGCSNWTLPRMVAMAAYASEHGLTGFAVSQPMWSLADINANAIGDSTLVPMDRAMHAYHATTGLSVMPYTATAGGYFAKRWAGKVSTHQRAMYDNPANAAIYDGLARLTHETGHSITVLSLLYFAAQPFPVVPLTAFSSQAQMADSLSLLQAEYPAELLAAIGELGKQKQFLHH